MVIGADIEGVPETEQLAKLEELERKDRVGPRPSSLAACSPVAPL
jgi:hypothetical protein